jgi:hypothetical protein
MVTHLKKVLPTVPKNSVGELQTSQLHHVVPDSKSSTLHEPIGV